MAESVELYLADLKYGLLHSDGQVNANRYANQAEELGFWLEENNIGFIPEGLFYDLFDENGVNPPIPIAPAAEPMLLGNPNVLVDNVSGFTFLDQLSALNPFTIDVNGFRTNLWQQSGPQGNTLAGFNQIFQDYGY